MASSEFTKASAKRVRDVLHEKSRTQEWLSEKTGTPMRTLSRRLHKVNPSSFQLEELAVIADALDVPLAYMLPQIGEQGRERTQGRTA